MAASYARGRVKLNPLHCLAAALMTLVIAVPAAADPPTPTPVDTIAVYFDQSRLIQLPERAANIVIGNPLIADVSIQPGGLTVITGKSYGATNFIATDKDGVVLLEKSIEVSGPRGRTLVVYNGGSRETYSCTPECSPRLTLGDNPETFTRLLSNITALNAQATAAGSLAAGNLQLQSQDVVSHPK
jgi:Pilus formation protein N terminal region